MCSGESPGRPLAALPPSFIGSLLALAAVTHADSVDRDGGRLQPLPRPLREAFRGRRRQSAFDRRRETAPNRLLAAFFFRPACFFPPILRRLSGPTLTRPTLDEPTWRGKYNSRLNSPALVELSLSLMLEASVAHFVFFF